jgi:hypothetical protein
MYLPSHVTTFLALGFRHLIGVAILCLTLHPDSAACKVMAPSQRELKMPDAEALEDDERQYGSGPLSMEELDLK